MSLASYYRRFIKNFAKISRPLHDLTKDNMPEKVEWTDKANESFHLLKQKLVEAPVLLIPDFDKPFYILCDASIDGLGSILSQKDDDGYEHPVTYASRSTTKGERNYGISKLKLCAVVWSLKIFRPYVLGNKCTVTVISDHAALNGLLKTNNPSGIIARWLQAIAEYDFKIEYRPGKKHNGPDFLSRLGY